MSFEGPAGESNVEQEQSFHTLDELLEALEQDGISTPFTADEIREQLEQTPAAIVTREYDCGIRIGKRGLESSGIRYIVFTTNGLEDLTLPLAQKYNRKEITID